MLLIYCLCSYYDFDIFALLYFIYFLFFFFVLIIHSNPQVQQAALKLEALPLLLRLLSKDEPMAVRKKALYALSSLIRLFPIGQKEFLKFSGLDIFQKLFEEPSSEPLLVKAITLMTDILTEQIEHVRNRLEKQGQDVSGEISVR